MTNNHSIDSVLLWTRYYKLLWKNIRHGWFLSCPGYILYPGGRRYQKAHKCLDLSASGHMRTSRSWSAWTNESHLTFRRDVTTGSSVKISKVILRFLPQAFIFLEKTISSPAKTFSLKPPMSSNPFWRQKTKQPAASPKVCEMLFQKAKAWRTNVDGFSLKVTKVPPPQLLPDSRRFKADSNSFRDGSDSLQVAHYQPQCDELQSAGRWQLLGGKGTYVLGIHAVSAGGSVVVLYSAEIDGDWDIYAIGVDGKNLRRITR